MTQVWIEESSDDLLEALSVRGLAARRVNGAIEVAADRLEIVTAVESWLEEADSGEVTARLGGITYTIRTHERLPAPPRERRRLDPLAAVAVLGVLLLLAAGAWLLAGDGFGLF